MPDKSKESQVAENNPNKVTLFSLTQTSKKDYLLPVSKKRIKPNIPKKVAFEPSAEERNIIEAAQGKHGINKATDIIRMALRRYAEAEGFKVAS